MKLAYKSHAADILSDIQSDINEANDVIVNTDIDDLTRQRLYTAIFIEIGVKLRCAAYTIDKVYLNWPDHALEFFSKNGETFIHLHNQVAWIYDWLQNQKLIPEHDLVPNRLLQWVPKLERIRRRQQVQ